MSCVHSRVTKFMTGNPTQVLCYFGHTSSPVEVTKKVSDCSTYYNSSLPSVGAMTEIAWELKTAGDGRKLGFKPPEKD